VVVVHARRSMRETGSASDPGRSDTCHTYTHMTRVTWRTACWPDAH